MEFITFAKNVAKMNLNLDLSKADRYTKQTQKARVVTEDWVSRNMYCPVCGAPTLTHYQNNKPVADFFCPNCKADFELKSKNSKNGHIGNKIADGAYTTMIERITSNNNPHLFVMTHDELMVNNFLLIPNYFFVPDIIIKRPALKPTAKRHGWIGCDIDYKDIPNVGKIFIVRDFHEQSKSEVVNLFKKSLGLNKKKMESRGWLMEVLKCLERIPNDDFTLKEVYAFADELHHKFPTNNFVRDKIRQQLQILRDKGFIKFVSPGVYHKIH